MAYRKMEKKLNKQDKRKEYARLIIALGVILLIICTLILYLSWPLLTGNTIILATRPVDPFDLFRGQYITINYEISNVNFTEVAKQGDNVYVLLKPDKDNIWRFEQASLTKPKQGIFIKGTVTRVAGESISLEYGVEQYFFERNAELPRTNITVEAKVDSSGNARIVNLLYNTKPIDINYKKPSLTS